MTRIALGRVGHWCWQTPQPTQPSGFTIIFPSASSIAWVPRGQASRQITHGSPEARRHAQSRQTAVPMSISTRGTGVRAPVGQAFMQKSPSQTTQGERSASMNATERPPGNVSRLMHFTGHDSTQRPEPSHFDTNSGSGSAPGGRSRLIARRGTGARSSSDAISSMASAKGSAACAKGRSSSKMPRRKNPLRFIGRSSAMGDDPRRGQRRRELGSTFCRALNCRPVSKSVKRTSTVRGAGSHVPGSSQFNTYS